MGRKSEHEERSNSSGEPKSLVDALFAEVFQTERSAFRHCSIEANRLGVAPPGNALRGVSLHARRAEKELQLHAERRGVGMKESALGAFVGTLFSTLRDNAADFTVTSEQSYRGTLLGMRHGYDVISLLGAAAQVEGDAELGAWCRGWMAERQPLIAAASDSLGWFASHPERALMNAKKAAKRPPGG